MLLLLNLSNTLWCTTVFTWCVDKICKAKCSLFFYAFLVVLCLGGLRWLGVTHVTYLDRTYRWPDTSGVRGSVTRVLGMEPELAILAAQLLPG